MNQMIEKTIEQIMNGKNIYKQEEKEEKNENIGINIEIQQCK